MAKIHAVNKKGRPKSYNPKTSQFRLRMTPEEHELIKRKARLANMTMSDYIRAYGFN